MRNVVWRLIDAVVMLSFVASLITSFVPAWNAAWTTLSPGLELGQFLWVLTMVRRAQATHDPYPSQHAAVALSYTAHSPIGPEGTRTVTHVPNVLTIKLDD